MATLIYSMGKNADKLTKSFDLSADDKNNFNTVIGEFIGTSNRRKM